MIEVEFENCNGYNLPVSGSGSLAPRRMVSDCRTEIRDRNSEFRIPNCAKRCARCVKSTAAK